MRARWIRRTVLTVALAGLVWAPVALAQHQHGAKAETAEKKACPGHAGPGGEGAAKPMSCKAMKAKKKEMMAKLKAMDATLQELVQRMEAAEGEAKIAAMEAVLTELVAQRTAMRGMMMHMQKKMMRHMMQHMKGCMKGAEGKAGGCPMMRGETGQDDTGDGEAGSGHAMHHEQ